MNPVSWAYLLLALAIIAEVILINISGEVRRLYPIMAISGCSHFILYCVLFAVSGH